MVEILASILVFSLGMVGVALFTANGLQNSANTHARATALHTASLVLEPLANNPGNATALAQALQNFVLPTPQVNGQMQVAPLPQGVEVSNDNGKDVVTLNIIRFQNGNGDVTDIANGGVISSGDLVSPVTVVFSVPYPATGGGTVTLFPSYTFLLDSASGGVGVGGV
jgi:hypothetical protein